MDNNCAATNVPIPNEKLKNCIKELQSEITNLKVDKLVLSYNVKSQVSEFQNMIQDLTKTISNFHNVLMPKPECSIESFKTRVNALLEDYFQCPICNEVMIKVSMAYCNHAFCESCISQWLKKSKNCPVCRSSLQTTTHCITIDNYINELCELIGGKVKEERDILQKERCTQEPSSNRGRKRKYTRRSQYPATRSLHVGTRNTVDTSVVDLTNTPS